MKSTLSQCISICAVVFAAISANSECPNTAASNINPTQRCLGSPGACFGGCEFDRADVAIYCVPNANRGTYCESAFIPPPGSFIVEVTHWAGTCAVVNVQPNPHEPPYYSCTCVDPVEVGLPHYSTENFYYYTLACPNNTADATQRDRTTTIASLH